MASKPISQREARRFKRRAEELEQIENRRRNSWLRSYPGGTHIGTVTNFNDRGVEIARRLGHACVIMEDGKIFALPLGK